MIDAPTVVGGPGILFRCILYKVLSVIVWTVANITILDFKCQHLYRRFNLNSKVCRTIVTTLLRKYKHNLIYFSCCISHRYIRPQKCARPTPDKIILYFSSVPQTQHFIGSSQQMNSCPISIKHNISNMPSHIIDIRISPYSGGKFRFV